MALRHPRQHVVQPAHQPLNGRGVVDRQPQVALARSELVAAFAHQHAVAVQQRLSGGYNGYGYSGYGYTNGYGGGRVLGISRVEPRSNGGLTVRGVATSGRNVGYAYGGYGGQGQVDLTWRCRVDYRGFVSDIDIDPAQRSYGSNYSNYSPYSGYGGNDYSQYGYRRY